MSDITNCSLSELDTMILGDLLTADDILELHNALTIVAKVKHLKDKAARRNDSILERLYEEALNLE